MEWRINIIEVLSKCIPCHVATGNPYSKFKRFGPIRFRNNVIKVKSCCDGYLFSKGPTSEQFHGRLTVVHCRNVESQSSGMNGIVEHQRVWIQLFHFTYRELNVQIGPVCFGNNLHFVRSSNVHQNRSLLVNKDGRDWTIA